MKITIYAMVVSIKYKYLYKYSTKPIIIKFKRCTVFLIIKVGYNIQIIKHKIFNF